MFPLDGGKVYLTLTKQLDILFERKIPARQFKRTQVNAFDVALHHQIEEDKPEVSHVEAKV